MGIVDDDGGAAGSMEAVEDDDEFGPSPIKQGIGYESMF